MKHISLKKQLCLVLAVLMLLSIMTACADSGDEQPDAVETTTPAPGADTPGEGTETTPAPEETTPATPDNLPADLKYNNEQIDFLAWKQGVVEYYADEQNGDAVNDAIYYRNMTVEERLGVCLVPKRRLNSYI